MPQAAYVRCNCTHVNPPWILNKNRSFGVKPVFTPFSGITERVHRFQISPINAVKSSSSKALECPPISRSESSKT